MRDDSSLYSGITSVTSNRLEERNKERKDLKRDVRQKLLPAGEIVQEVFKAEVQKLMYGPYDDEENMTDEQFRIERQSRRRAIAAILSMQAKINNLLREDGRTDTNTGV